MATTAAARRRAARLRRRARVRRRLAGTEARPRLSVFRSLQHIYGQVIDDTRGHTVAAASTRDPDLAAKSRDGGKVGGARLVGRALAQRAQAVGVKCVVFDRGGYRYHGRVRALAEGAREEGLEF